MRIDEARNDDHIPRVDDEGVRGFNLVIDSDRSLSFAVDEESPGAKSGPPSTIVTISPSLINTFCPLPGAWPAGLR